MKDYQEVPSVPSFLWFLFKNLICDVIFVFLLYLALNSLKIADLPLAIILLVAGFLFFVCFFIFYILYLQEKEIEKDNEEHNRNLQKI